jgi:cell division protein FtsB
MNRLKIILEKIPAPLQNKFLLSFVFFIVWMLFFDKNNFFSQKQTQTELNKWRQQRNFYVSEIESINQTRTALFSNQDNLETFARERYLMKKDNEDLFLIETDSAKQ